MNEATNKAYVDSAVSAETAASSFGASVQADIDQNELDLASAAVLVFASEH